MAKKKKVILPPQLPPDIPDEEIEVSDEDLNFVSKNIEYAGFLSKLDANLINRCKERVFFFFFNLDFAKTFCNGIISANINGLVIVIILLLSVRCFLKRSYAIFFFGSGFYF